MDVTCINVTYELVVFLIAAKGVALNSLHSLGGDKMKR